MKSLFSGGALLLSTLLLSTLVAAQDYTCSASKPCALGCCSKSGYCGMGPDFCGANCISQCDQKSDCDPGWGAQWSKKEGCPLNVCCSKFGFCGYTADFCGDKPAPQPQCHGNPATGFRQVGYFEGWGASRGCDVITPDQIPVNQYTHLNYAFALIDPSSFAVVPMAGTTTDSYAELIKIKQKKQGLQVWISIGGWSFNDPGPTQATFSQLAASVDAQTKFINSLIAFMKQYGFDGVDIDWEYPVASERGGTGADFDNYTSFLRNVRQQLTSNGNKFGLSITLPASFWYLQNFDISNMEPLVDFFNVMTYDLHGTWDATDKWIGAVIGAHTNLTEIDTALSLLWRSNIDPSKVNLGLGYYGRSFTLSDPSCTTPGCGFSGPGNPGSCTKTGGILSDKEINDIVKGGARVTFDPTAAVKEAVWGGNQWVSYDDIDTLSIKLDYAHKHCLGGTMIWAVDLADPASPMGGGQSGGNGGSGGNSPPPTPPGYGSGSPGSGSSGGSSGGSGGGAIGKPPGYGAPSSWTPPSKFVVPEKDQKVIARAHATPEKTEL